MEEKDITVERLLEDLRNLFRLHKSLLDDHKDHSGRDVYFFSDDEEEFLNSVINNERTHIYNMLEQLTGERLKRTELLWMKDK